MDCGAINEKLSAYLDGELSAAEMAEVEEHIKACPACGPAFEELQKTSARIRGLEDVEPPEWLQQRIMTKVREEDEQKRGLLHKLFFPIRFKVPLQAAATLAICVIAFLVYRAVEPDTKQARRLQKQPVVTGQAEEGTLSEEYERTDDIPESGAGGYPEMKAAPAPASPDELDMAREKLRSRTEEERTTGRALRRENGTYGQTGIGPAGDQPAGSVQLFSPRRGAAADKARESFQAEIVRYGSPSNNDRVIEVLFRHSDTGELFCGSFSPTHSLSRFIFRFRENTRQEPADTLPALKVTAGPPYRGGCLLYDISRKVISWESTEKNKPRSTNSK